VFTSVLAVVVGLALLMLAADRLVIAAVRVSRALGISAILIGALVVGLGTSIPELLVSVLAGADDKVDVAMANVVGSNIANVTLVLGAATLIGPVRARLQTLNREGILMLVAVVGLAAVLTDGEVEAWEGGMLLFGMLVALYFLIRWSLADSASDYRVEQEVREVIDGTERPLILEIVFGLAALAVTIYSADLLLGGALDVGADLGLSDAFLGVMLGVGTSLPEMATAVASIRRKESDLVVGNVLGSNLFNSLAVAGTAAVVGAGPLVELGSAALWTMVGAAVLAGLMSRTGRHQLVRRDGLLLIAVFVAFAVLTY
jgi:cation:H+ antiporter